MQGEGAVGKLHDWFCEFDRWGIHTTDAVADVISFSPHLKVDVDVCKEEICGIICFIV